MPENELEIVPHPFGLPFSRRLFLKGAAGATAAIAVSPYLFDARAFASLGSGTTPEQVHLQWGADPSTSIVVSWAAPSGEAQPQVTYGVSVVSPSAITVPAVQKSYTDGLSGETVYTYHAALSGLEPSTAYQYVISDGASPPNTFPASGNAPATFTTAPTGRSPFSFTSFGDLGTPGAPYSANSWGESQANAYFAVSQVETLGPLFHLMNGDLAYADKAPTASTTGAMTNLTPSNQPQPDVWRDYGLNVQRSAANRPWMPCIGNHESEVGSTAYTGTAYASNSNGITFDSTDVTNGAGVYSNGGTFTQYGNGMYGHASYLTRFMLPEATLTGADLSAFDGSFYSFQVGSVLFISLDAADVAYQDSGAFTLKSWTNPISSALIPANSGVYNRQYTGELGTPNADNTIPAGNNLQTQWLEATLAAAATDASIDWIVVQMHQPALSSAHDNGSDLGIRQVWLPLFDKYQVDLVLYGHDHDYERSFPVRGFNHNQGTGLPTTTVTTLPNPSATPPVPGSPLAGTGTSGSQRAGKVVDTLQPNPVVTDPSLQTFDTSQGTVHLVLGGGGTNAPDNLFSLYEYGLPTVINGVTVPAAGVNTYTNPKIVAVANKGLPDTWEPAIWSAKTDQASAMTSADKSNGTNAYGIALFTVDPGLPGGTTSITLEYLHTSLVSSTYSGTNGNGTATAPAAPTYTPLETITFTRPRSDASPAPRLAEFPTPILGVLAAGAIGAGALYLAGRDRAEPSGTTPSTAG